MSLLTIEVLDISFSDTDQSTILFTNAYALTPSVTATVVNTAGSILSNINVFVENITTTGATIRVSDNNYTGTVHVQIIGI
jgi:hypothetical protein